MERTAADRGTILKPADRPAQSALDEMSTQRRVTRPSRLAMGAHLQPTSTRFRKPSSSLPLSWGERRLPKDSACSICWRCINPCLGWSFSSRRSVQTPFSKPANFCLRPRRDISNHAAGCHTITTCPSPERTKPRNAARIWCPPQHRKVVDAVELIQPD